MAIIPFKLTELTQNVNPVKLYEYLSAGVPVVAAPMSELLGLTRSSTWRGAIELRWHRSNGHSHEDDEGRRAARRLWASSHDWTSSRECVPRRHRRGVREGQRCRALLQQLGRTPRHAWRAS